MDAFTRNDLKSLLETDDGLRASIFMPTHRTGREVRQDPVRLKNLIAEAEERLTGAGMRSTQAREILKTARELQSDEAFWEHQSDGLALFAAEGVFRRYRVPLALQESVTVTRRYQVKPLLPLLQADGRFHVLAVSMNRVRLFEATHYHITELAAPSLPKNLRDALHIDEFVQSLQQHQHTTMGVGGSGAKEAMFHGHGGGSLDAKKRHEIREFFHRIDQGLKEFLSGEAVPLVFAGVDYLFPIFKEASDHNALIDEPITGNPDDAKPEELHEKAWAAVRPYFKAARSKALNRATSAIDTDHVSQDLSEIFKASKMARIDELFVARGYSVRGLVDEETADFAVGHDDAPESEDLVDYAVVQTLINGGTVHVVDAEEINGGSKLMAAFRYPIPAQPAEP